jgi:MFS family permease
MSVQLIDRVETHPARKRRHLPRGVAFYLLASIIVGFLAASAAPTPLYSVYAGEWGFSPITTTVVFGIYALAVLAGLLTVGSVSDHIGRRPVLLVAIAVQAITMWIYATADGVPQLFVARVVQGLATGAAAGAVGAGLLDLDKAKGAVANAVAPLSGTAIGSVVSGLLVQFLPAPTHLVYFVLFGIFLLQAAGVALMAETVTRRPGAFASLRPDVSLPPAVRRPMYAAAPVLLAIWSLAGLYGALGPALVRQIVGFNSFLLGGLSLFALAGAGALSVLVLRRVEPGRMMLTGVTGLIGGVAVTLLGIASASVVMFFLGTLISGFGFGGALQGAIRTVVPLAAAHERAGVLSLVYVVSYLGMGLPAVIAGWLVVHGGGLQRTAEQYGLAVIVLAAGALVMLVANRRRVTGRIPA